MTALTNLFGSTKAASPQIQFNNVPAFSGGGLFGELNKDQGGGSYNVTADANRTGVVQSLGDVYKGLGDITGTLRDTVAPGFNQMLTSRLNDLSDIAHSAIGNLRDNLSARRVLGSSFGMDTLSRANAEFGRARDAAIADNFLKSLQMNNALLTQQYEAYAKQHQTALNELNLEGGIASDLSAKSANILAENARTQATLNEKNGEFNANMSNNQASGLGGFLGRVGGSFFGL